jgi:hypothetical protein
MRKLTLLLIFACSLWGQGSPYTAATSGSSVLAGELNGKLNHQYASGAPSSKNCTQGRDVYTDTATNILYVCSVTGTPGTWVTIYSLITNLATSQIADAAITPVKSATSLRKRPCEVHIWGSGTAGALQATDDAPLSCFNKYGATLTIESVECAVDTGTTTTVNVINTGGSSVLTGATMTAGNGTLAAGTLSGTPTQSANTSLDILTLVQGTANHLVCVIGRTL